ncbi:class II aldolase/adducin family protein [Paenarthrobacter sp. PAE-2]|uniref:class II aldolase/adducin family protein n=1 Tax=Paenarthrobacter sp. PAE-2 TaxID=2982532 RepID=UPI0022329FBD|nr:class II aldolase/adducin family protein [Paenarthrobacter sp. PAE-2]MCW3768646.1 class II aldolase/adducin family protein [Paenarthrobacter sp. PAE-2]
MTTIEIQERDIVGENLITELVAANRILVRQGVLDAFGHVSARSAPGASTFLLSRNLAPGSVTRNDVMTHDLDGVVLDDDRPAYLERFIHAEIYRRRPDVMSVVHSHSAAVVPFSVVEAPFRPVIHMAGFLNPEGTPVFEISDFAGDGSDLLVTNGQLGSDLAGALGDGNVALMRGHGSIAVGSSLPEVVYRAVYTEVNARAQLEASVLGTPRFLSRGEAATANGSVGGQALRAWNVWRAQVAKEVGSDD